ncbi:MAG: hypothetical protein JKY65_25645 [Planctomycetes bacterium]|nr:hypothetical protein [Planctomycetota bacterium]
MSEDPPSGSSDEHYAAVAARYEQSAFYDPASSYNRWLIPHVVAALGLEPASRFADLGGGTGAFTAALSEAAGLTTLPSVVEPSPLREQATARGLPGLDEDAATFAGSPGVADWDALLLKEVVHHLSLGAFPEICLGLARRLSAHGRLVTITRPVEPDYPLFSAAKIVWRMNQPPASRYVSALEAAGLEVEEQEHAFRFEIPREEWFTLVRNRFWSTFSAFSDEQLEAGIRELEERYKDPILSFEDRLVFLVAKHAGP